MLFEINTTYRCNVACDQCNRAVGLVKFPDSDMTIGQAERLVDKLREHRIHRVTIGGGEPLVNPNLQGIVDAVARLGPLRRGYRILTNGMSPKRQAAIRMPDGFRWVVADAKQKDHYPQWWSPKDLGYEYTGSCRIIRSCGRGFDASGFLICGIAGVLGRLLGVNPYARRVRTDMQQSICWHCQHTLPKKTIYRIHRRIRDGQIEFPTRTWKRSLARGKRLPKEYARW